MKTVLHIDSSVRRSDNSVTSYNSISKDLGALFMDKWMSRNHQDKVIYRDLGLNPPEFICQDWIAAVFTQEEKRSPVQEALLALSDTLISELEQADLIVITAPMYNYGMPACLKAWFDQVVRVDKTFSFDLGRGDFPLEPIMSGKTLILLTSSGEFGFASGGIREQMNHLGPHVKLLSKYLGVSDIHEVGVEYQEFSDHRHEQSIQDAQQGINELVKCLSDELAMATS
ncbi:MAG: NAD(P)H-dependent oxidoreductase [Bermanella sp.]